MLKRVFCTRLLPMHILCVKTRKKRLYLSCFWGRKSKDKPKTWKVCQTNVFDGALVFGFFPCFWVMWLEFEDAFLGKNHKPKKKSNKKASRKNPITQRFKYKNRTQENAPNPAYANVNVIELSVNCATASNTHACVLYYSKKRNKKEKIATNQSQYRHQNFNAKKQINKIIN